MEKLQEILTTMSSLNINIDSDVFAYYRYKVSLIDSIFSVFSVIIACLIIWVYAYFIAKMFKDD